MYDVLYSHFLYPEVLCFSHIAKKLLPRCIAYTIVCSLLQATLLDSKQGTYEKFLKTLMDAKRHRWKPSKVCRYSSCILYNQSIHRYFCIVTSIHVYTILCTMVVGHSLVPMLSPHANEKLLFHTASWVGPGNEAN